MADHADIDHSGLTGVPGSNPQFTTIELGHASDTTLARVSAGVVSIEGTNIVKAGAATSSGLTMATSRLLGRTTASSGAIEEITVGSGLSLSAGSLTATGGSGISSGTSFPGSPSTGDLFHRTDITPALWRYDGTRWLCTCIHEHFLGQMTNVSATTAEVYSPVRPEAMDMWLVDLITTMLAASGLSGSAFWTVECYSYTAAGGSTLRASTNNTSGTNNQHTRKVTAIDALAGSTIDAFSVRAVKTSTPGNFTGGAMLTYHLVGT